MDEDTLLILWLNGLGLESTLTVDSWKDLSINTVCDVASLILGKDEVDSDIVSLLCEIDTTFGIPMDIYVEHVQNEQTLTDDMLQDLVRIFREIYTAGFAWEDRNEDAVPPPPPFEKISEEDNIREENSNIFSSEAIPPPPDDPPPDDALSMQELGARIRTMIPTSTFLEQRLADLCPVVLADGLLLCHIVLACEKRLGLPPRRDTVVRRLGQDNLLFFAGVEVNPRSRASKLKNIELSIAALRGWKRFVSRLLFSGMRIVDASTDEGLWILDEIVTYTERNIQSETVRPRRLSEPRYLPVEPKLEMPRRGSLPEPSSSSRARVSKPETSSVKINKSKQLEIANHPVPRLAQMTSTDDIYNRFSASLELKGKHRSILESRRSSESEQPVRSILKPSSVSRFARRVGFVDDSADEDPYPRPTTPPIEDFVQQQREPQTPPPPPPPYEFDDENRVVFRSSGRGALFSSASIPSAMAIVSTAPSEESMMAGLSSSDSNLSCASESPWSNTISEPPRARSELRSETSLIPPILEVGATARQLKVTAKSQSTLLQFLKRGDINISPQEKILTRLWLYRLGFNILRVNVHPLRAVPTDEANTKLFWGYEGGPFLGDPFRNGIILFEIAEMLRRSLDGGASMTPSVLHTDVKSFPSAKQRLDHTFDSLRELAVSHGLNKSLGGLLGEHVKVGVLSGGRETFNLMFALSLAFPVEADSTEQMMWESLQCAGLVTVANGVNESLFEQVFSGQVFRNVVRVLQPQNTGLLSIPRTRRTALISIERCLVAIGVVRKLNMTASTAAQRLLDGDLRLFLQIAENFPMELIAKETNQMASRRSRRLGGALKTHKSRDASDSHGYDSKPRPPRTTSIQSRRDSDFSDSENDSAQLNRSSNLSRLVSKTPAFGDHEYTGYVTKSARPSIQLVTIKKDIPPESSAIVVIRGSEKSHTTRKMTPGASSRAVNRASRRASLWSPAIPFNLSRLSEHSALKPS